MAYKTPLRIYVLLNYRTNVRISQITTLKSNRALTFKTQYVDRYKSEPDFSAVFGYETAEVLVQALQKSSRLTPKVIKSQLLSSETFHTVQGQLKFNAYGEVNRESYVYTIHEGQFVKLK